MFIVPSVSVWVSEAKTKVTKKSLPLLVAVVHDEEFAARIARAVGHRAPQVSTSLGID
jgi:hypothetical protein